MIEDPEHWEAYYPPMRHSASCSYVITGLEMLTVFGTGLTRKHKGSNILKVEICRGYLVKKPVLCLALLLAVFLSIWGQKEEECLKVDAAVNPRWLSRGQEGKVVLKIKLAEGIDIHPQPSFIIECNPSDELIFPKSFFTASDLEIEIKEENAKESLNLDKPIEIPFTVSLEAQRGNHTFEGKIKYFAFSKQEDWCLKNTAKFRVSFYTRSTSIKKETP